MAGTKPAPKTWYVAEDVRDLLDQILTRYPYQSGNQIINAALRYYIPKALNGLDADLMPLTDSPSVLVDMLEDSVRRLATRQRPTWTDEQRTAFRALRATDPTISPDMVVWVDNAWKILR